MDVAISCLARNKLVNMDHLFSETNPLKHVVNELVLSKSLFHSWNFFIKSNRYLSDLLVNNQVIHRLFSEKPIIPEDIIRLEILTRLPLKSLLRFQCVCKSWQALISQDPVFINSHLARTCIDPSNDWIIVRCGSILADTDDFPNKYKHPLQSGDMKLAGTVNGIVCVYRYHWCSKSVPCIGIWNPATHQYKDVPPPSTASDVKVYDLFFAFAFDSFKNDYKVIYVTKNKGMQLVADVYSCNADSWGNINVYSSFVVERGGIHSKRIINVNESVYWIYAKGEKSSIVSFDTTREVFRLLPVLNHLPNQKWALVNLRNYLASLVHDWVETTYVDVYVLNETVSRGGGTWSKMYTVGPITGLTNRMYIFHCFRNGDFLFIDDKQCKLVCLDPETHAVLGSSSYTFHTNRLSFAYGFSYTETLVSVMGMKHISKDECDYLLFI